MQIFRSLSITGASSGIGEATAELLAAKGAKVVLGARRADLLATLTERIRQAGGHAVYLQMDVTERTEVASLVNLALNEFGRLDVIINNAGISQLQLLEDVDVEGWSK
ncbi:SDR family NAD(P)-dependent oxidoreductase [Dyadobacter sp. CY107]|uniref:SDR family oxidoreductase n=1 Tax=Dyadobacter fanqingshengii TaxID=2906443 RepID=UPI001F2DE5BC|nr:SDR family NAD(P)-dependent oxidoreductase [Dyadobacter fanqingshengii]MCF2505329.1 SDR family NAD(P)-dependent oxidoreductase [Dyadobacter fanqingshengii]